MDFKIDHGFGLEGSAQEETLPPADTAWRACSLAAGGSIEADLPDVATVAELVNRRRNPDFSAVQFYEHVTELAESAGVNAQRLSELIPLLSTTALAAAISAGKSIAQRKRLLQNLADMIAVPAILPLIRAASRAYGQPLSPVMERLLNKAEQQAIADPAQHTTYVALVRDIIETWSASSVDTTGTGYESIFGQGEQQTVERSSRIAPEPERLIALSFETGALGNAVWNALARLGRDERGTRKIVDMLKAAPENSRAADMVAAQFATPSRLAMLLREDTVDFAVVDVLLSHMQQETAAPTLLEALIDAKTSAQRRALLERIVALGSTICELCLERLKSETRPTALRDLLAVVREASCDARDIAIETFTRHEDARVRKEAMRLQFRDPVARDRAVVVALRDPEEELLKIGLKAARDSLPEAAVPLLARRVADPTFPAQYRTSVLHLLARSQSVLALEVLLGFAVSGKTFLGKPALAPKSPEMLIAVSGLARMWSHDRRVADLLERARKSDDREITDALDASQLRAPVPEMEIADDDE